jgi:hypothetical protein
MLYEQQDTFPGSLGQDKSCKMVIDGNLGALVHIVVIEGFAEFLLVQVAEELIALLGIALEEGNL